MSKRLSEKQKEEITKYFSLGKTIDELSEKFECTKLTISRNLKKILGEKKYKELIKNSKFTKIASSNEQQEDSLIVDVEKKQELYKEKDINLNFFNKPENEFFTINQFTEISPLDCEIENTNQKDLSSIHITDVILPKTVYMIVDKKNELETKYLKDYPEWQFLSQNELNRKTIQIHVDPKVAKIYCNNGQKVIKVPNTNVFKIVAPILVSRGISRIVSEDNLISL